MVTTKCSTNCIYCYANRTLNPTLETEKLLHLIKELHNQGTVNITLTGGDIFAHPDWEQILKCTRQYKYKPFLSTKTPLSREQIKILKDLGYEELQFSLDSVDPDILHKMIGVETHYLSNVSEFLKNCSELDLNVMIRSVLTKLNAALGKIRSLYDYLSKFSCVKEWVMTPAFFSPYKAAQYKAIEVNNTDLIDVYTFTQSPNLAFKIGLNKITDKGYVLRTCETPEEFVHQNQICMGNTTCISILADGHCSICEMLYNNPDYIIGNVLDSSIKNIWNSEKALELYNMTQWKCPHASPCRVCKVFDQCRNDFGKRVCYVDIAKSGHSKWEPDPRCPHSDQVDLVL